MAKDEIIFTDLHGVPDDEAYDSEVNLEGDDKGIARIVPDAAADPVSLEGIDVEEDEPRIPRTPKAAAPTDDDEDSEYGKKVRARIERERRATAAERGRAEAAEAELARMRRSVIDEKITNAKAEVGRIETEVTQIETDLEKALEDGKTKEAVRLTSRLTDIKARRERLNAQMEDGPPEAPIAPVVDTNKARLVTGWKAKHVDWYAKEGFERYTRSANRIDKELAAEGYDSREQDYFDELDRRLRKEAPAVFDDKADMEDKEDTTVVGKKGPATVAPVRDGSRGGKQSERASMTRVVITREDKAEMRRFNLDPNDPRVLREWAANKRQSTSDAS
jgi:hypothetical protein